MAPSDSRLLRFARKVRHAPGLNRLGGLWRTLRPMYHQILERVHGGRGIPLSLGAGGTMHVPASFVHNAIDPLELAMLDVLTKHVKPDDCFYDVGASLGLHSLAVGEHLKRSGAIHAFEPEPASALEYWANTRLLRSDGIDVELHRCFVADVSRNFVREKTRAAFTDLDLARSKGALAHHLYLANPASAAEHPSVALDEYVTGGVRGPTLIKCDIEGAELLFLRGASRVIKQYQPTLFLSVHPTLLPQFGHTVDDVRQWLADQGYGWELIDESGEMHIFAQPVGRAPALATTP